MEILFKELSYEITGVLMEVHRQLGSGFLENVYAQAIAVELAQRPIRFRREFAIPVTYKGQIIGRYKCDFLIEESVILEVKAISSITRAHITQVLNYLAGTKLRLGILANFGARSLEYRRIVR